MALQVCSIEIQGLSLPKALVSGLNNVAECQLPLLSKPRVRSRSVLAMSTSVSPGTFRAKVATLVSPSPSNEEVFSGAGDGEEQVPVIQLIATDVDGTLLDSQQKLSARNVQALRLAKQQGIEVVVATGKARGPWIHDVLPRLGLTSPGVYLQGLMIYNADGTVRYERYMDEDLAKTVIDIAEKEGITLTAYCGERILCQETNWHTDRLIGYGEPPPEAVGPLSDIVGSVKINKLLFMADDSWLADLRPAVERALGDRATVVTALHGMLEILPLGASKAHGLRMILDDMKVDPENVMALGDGENDLEMLRMAGLSVAMGNAGPAVKAAAGFVTDNNDNDGLAKAVESFILEPGVWCWD